MGNGFQDKIGFKSHQFQDIYADLSRKETNGWDLNELETLIQPLRTLNLRNPFVSKSILIVHFYPKIVDTQFDWFLFHYIIIRPWELSWR